MAISLLRWYASPASSKRRISLELGSCASRTSLPFLYSSTQCSQVLASSKTLFLSFVVSFCCSCSTNILLRDVDRFPRLLRQFVLDFYRHAVASVLTPGFRPVDGDVEDSLPWLSHKLPRKQAGQTSADTFKRMCPRLAIFAPAHHLPPSTIRRTST